MKKPVIIVVISFSLLFIVITSLFTFRKVELFNNKFSYYASSIDLSNYPIEDFSLWENKLSDFNHLKEVVVNNKSISYEKKLELEKKYPDIIFNIKSLIYMNGLSFDSESEEIDLSTTVVDDSIKDYLSKFKNLKKVIISNKMDTDKQIELEQEFNNIEFIWPVKIADKLISSDVETLDLSYAQIKNINEFDKSLSLLHKLKNLDLSYSNLSYKQMGDMRERFPNI